MTTPLERAEQAVSEVAACDLTPGMRIPWCNEGATVLAVTTRTHIAAPKSSWTRVHFRADSGYFTHCVDWPESVWVVLPGFDVAAVVDQISYALRSGNHGVAAELRALITSHASKEPRP